LILSLCIIFHILLLFLEQASCAEDCGNSIPYPGSGESFGKLLSWTAAAGNFITECLPLLESSQVLAFLAIMLCQMHS
jgi:hypothetical protein